MKKSTLLLTLLALGASFAQAAQVYTITLTSAERFTDCTVIYKSSSTTKFRGTNKAGKTVTKEVPTQSIIMMREVVKEEPEPEKKTEAPAPETPAPSDQKATDPKPAESHRPEARRKRQRPGSEGRAPARTHC